jgi:hypothetical protein
MTCAELSGNSRPALPCRVRMRCALVARVPRRFGACAVRGLSFLNNSFSSEFLHVPETSLFICSVPRRMPWQGRHDCGQGREPIDIPFPFPQLAIPGDSHREKRNLGKPGYRRVAIWWNPRSAGNRRDEQAVFFWQAIPFFPIGHRCVAHDQN